MKKLSSRKRTPENDKAGKALMASARSLKKAGALLLKAIHSLPENDTSLNAATDALISARCALINAAQMLAEAGDVLEPANKILPPAAERLRALQFTLN